MAEKQFTTTTDPWQSALQFSNTIPNLNIEEISSHSRQETSNSGNESQGTKETLPAYVDYSEQPQQPPPKPRKTYTGLSVRSTISSAWSKTVDYGVSHFNVPRLAAPWEHEISKRAAPPISHTVREFNPRRQRRRLYTNSTFQFFLTLLFTGGLAATLAGFATVLALSQTQKHAFNAIITMLSILLGLNLASSFQGYAQMLRWRFLASSYRTLQEFELVMQCESQMKVLRLFWTARTRGKFWINKTQWLCISWIGVNTLLQVLVALLGLTYSLDSSTYINQQLGYVSVVDLSVISDSYSSVSDPNFYQQLALANTYGIESSDYALQFATTYENETAQQTVYTDEQYSTYFYRFTDANANNTQITVVTLRTISATAQCREHKLVAGGWGNDTTTTYIAANGDHVTISPDAVSPGVITYGSKMHSNCGRRCTEMQLLQSADGVTVVEPHFFLCNNTVSHVTNWDLYGDSSLYDMPNEQARIIAGAAGWSGFYYVGTDWQWNMYSQGTFWSPSYDMAASGASTSAAGYVMDFAMGAVAAMDYQAPRTTAYNWAPEPAVLVNVDWQWTGAVLGSIPLIQLLALLCIITWANKAIIKDTSFLSTARLLRPIVDRLEDRGCLLTGDEIAEEMRNVKIAYGYREPEGFMEDGDMVRHVDVLEESEGLLLDNRMPRGRYDGVRKRNAGGLEAREGEALGRMGL